VKTIKVDSREVLADIRSGMSDMTLMAKYKLSSRGLQSLFKKLGESGLLKQLNAREVIDDLRAGMSRGEIMEKYALSIKGFEALLVEIDRHGLRGELAKNYSLPMRISVRVPDIVRDIRSGASQSDLLKKYSLTSRGLRWALVNLISSGAISWQEVCGNICSSVDELIPDKPRHSKRLEVEAEVPIHDVGNPQVKGTVRNVSERGIGVKGIRATPGELKTLVICADEFGEYTSFPVEAVCKWACRDPQGDHVAGFEISQISMGSRREFQLFMKMIRMAQEGFAGNVTGVKLDQEPETENP
jgi:uncharacterized protein (DUF433 family)